MAWNPSPHVADCREIASKWNCQQVIIIAVRSDGRFEAASYGKTKSLCDKAGKAMNDICSMIEYGEIEID